MKHSQLMRGMHSLQESDLRKGAEALVDAAIEIQRIQKGVDTSSELREELIEQIDEDPTLIRKLFKLDFHRQ